MVNLWRVILYEQSGDVWRLADVRLRKAAINTLVNYEALTGVGFGMRKKQALQPAFSHKPRVATLFAGGFTQDVYRALQLNFLYGIQRQAV